MCRDVKYPHYGILHARQDSNKMLGTETAKYKIFRSQNFNEEIKTSSTEETHKAVVNTALRKRCKNMFSLP